MANVKISELPAIASLAVDDLVPVRDTSSSTTKSATFQQMVDIIGSSFIDSGFRVNGSADATKQLAFEVDGITPGTVRTITIQDKPGTLAITGEFVYTTGLGDAGGAGPGRLLYPSKYIAGFTYANNGTDAVNDLDIAAGEARDATNTYNIRGLARTKQSDITWAVGTNAGMLDTGAVGNSDYYIWAIGRSDTGVVDYLSSLSSTAPTMPTSYDFKRLIGWFKRVGGTIVAFTTYETEGGGLELLWTSPTLDINLANTLTTTRRTDAVKVPLNFSVRAFLNVGVTDGSSTGAWVYCPDQADLAPSLTVAPLITHVATVAGTLFPSTQTIRTSAAGLIAARATAATMDLYVVSTMGFTWARRN